MPQTSPSLGHKGGGKSMSRDRGTDGGQTLGASSLKREATSLRGRIHSKLMDQDDPDDSKLKRQDRALGKLVLPPRSVTTETFEKYAKLNKDWQPADSDGAGLWLPIGLLRRSNVGGEGFPGSPGSAQFSAVAEDDAEDDFEADLEPDTDPSDEKPSGGNNSVRKFLSDGHILAPSDNGKIGDAASDAKTAKPRSFLGLPIMGPNNTFLLLWTSLILVIDALYTAIWVPIAVAFEPPYRIFSATGSLDFAIGLILLGDIVMRFHSPITLATTYKRVTLMEPRAIASFYISRGSFLLDLLAATPLIVVPFLDSRKGILVIVLILRSLRLLRVRKVIKAIFLIQVMSVAGTNSFRMMFSNMMSLLYTLLIMVNFMACLWYYIGTRGEPGLTGWLSEEYKFNRSPDEDRCNDYIAELQAEGENELASEVDCSALLFAGGDAYHWIIAVYYVIVTLTTVGYGDITPASTKEVWTSLFIMMCGLIMFGWLLGSIANLMASSSQEARRAERVKDKLTAVQQWMSHNKLNSRTRGEIIRFYAEDWGNVEEDEDVILEEIPIEVRANAVWCLVKQNFRAVPLFKYVEVRQGDEEDRNLGIARAQKLLASKMTPLTITRGMYVCHQGDEADCVYFLQLGAVDILHMGYVVGHLEAPTTFGEPCLLHPDMPGTNLRISGYRTTETSKIWQLPRDEVSRLSSVIPGIREQLQKGLEETVHQKCRRLEPAQLRLVQLFLDALHQSSVVMDQATIDAMTRHLNGVVDMGIVQILAYFDRLQHEAKAASDVTRTHDDGESGRSAPLAPSSWQAAAAAIASGRFKALHDTGASTGRTTAHTTGGRETSAAWQALSRRNSINTELKTASETGGASPHHSGTPLSLPPGTGHFSDVATTQEDFQKAAQIQSEFVSTLREVYKDRRETKSRYSDHHSKAARSHVPSEHSSEQSFHDTGHSFADPTLPGVPPPDATPTASDQLYSPTRSVPPPPQQQQQDAQHVHFSGPVLRSSEVPPSSHGVPHSVTLASGMASVQQDSSAADPPSPDAPASRAHKGSSVTFAQGVTSNSGETPAFSGQRRSLGASGERRSEDKALAVNRKVMEELSASNKLGSTPGNMDEDMKLLHGSESASPSRGPRVGGKDIVAQALLARRDDDSRSKASGRSRSTVGGQSPSKSPTRKPAGRSLTSKSPR